MSRTSWHPAAVQAFENELEDCRKDLAIEAEHQLTTEPLRIDVLIIKKKRNIVLKKNIAQIFRQHNIVEYKSPEDSVSVENYHKTHAYVRLYASLNKVDINEVSLTVAATRHPRKLLAFLKNQCTVLKEQPGIYLVKGEIYPTQVIVGAELSEKDNFWLANLRNDLTAEQLAQVLTAAVDKSNVDAYMHAITSANLEKMEELYMKKKDVIFTEKLDAYFAERYSSREAKRGRSVLLAVLQARFKKIPKGVEQAINEMSDPIALESWTVQAATSQSMDEFAKALNG